MMATLEVVSGLNPGQEFPLERERSVLGRHPDCDIVLDAGAVSRQHAQILALDGKYYVEDLRSRNGTFVNGQLISGRRVLHDSDELKICDLVFTFHEQAPGKRGSGRTTEEFPGAVLVDDSELTTSSTIMSKLDVSSSGSGLRVTVNPETKLRAMIEITRNLATSLELDEVLPKILDSLFKVFLQADRGFIVLRETPDGPLLPKAVKHRRTGSEDTIRISRTVVNQAMTTKEALLSADAASDSRFQMSESIADFRIRSMMCAPLIDSMGRALGVIQIDTLDQRSRFQQEDLDVLASVALQAAVAVENAQLHEAAIKQKAYERDLALAHKVQQGLLPAAPPCVPGYQFFDYYEPANQVGGDYYDYVMLPGDRLAVIVADVSGKGIAAALLMAKISAEARYLLASERDPAVALARLNANFAASGWEDRFVTMVLAVIHLREHSLMVLNAGHMPPYIRRAGGEVEVAGGDQAGVPLGVDGDYAYKQFICGIEPGDAVVLFTDGINEAMNAAGELYSLQRIRDQLAVDVEGRPEVSRGDVSAVMAAGRALLDDVREFVGNRPQNDDMCLVCIGRTPEGMSDTRKLL